MAKGRNSQTIQSEKNIIIFRDVYKVTEAYIEPARDPMTKRFADCVREVDDKGNMILSDTDKASNKVFIKINDALLIKDGTQLDLNNSLDAAWWDAIKYSVLIARCGRWERDAEGKLIIDGDAHRYGNANFYIEVPGESSKKSVKKIFLTTDAINFIKDDTYEGLVMKTRLLGNWMKDASMSDIQEYLISHANSDPQKIIDLYDSYNASFEIMLLDAIDAKVITQNRGIFYFGTTQLGTNRESVIESLKDENYKSVLESIKKELYN